VRSLIVRNVAQQVKVSPGEPEEVVPLTVAEARMLLRTAREHRLYALYAVALSIGLRRGEALGLRWSDVDLETGLLRVRQTLQRHSGELHFAPPKTRRSRRTVPLLPFMVAALHEHRDRQAEECARAGDAWTDSGLVFTTSTGRPIEPNDFSKAFGRMCDRAGVRKVRVHDLRHTCASMLLAQGAQPRVVMEVLGHSAVEMTMNVYGHVMLDAQREALAGMDALLSE
jgi:integrase